MLQGIKSCVLSVCLPQYTMELFVYVGYDSCEWKKIVSKQNK